MNTLGNKYIGLGDLVKLKGLLIVHMNVRSIFAKIDILRNDLQESNIDVLCNRDLAP